MSDKDSRGENYYIQVTESINSLYELTTRVDERQQLMMAKVNALEEKLDSQLKEHQDLEGRIRVMESKDNGVADLSRVKESIHNHDKRLQALEISSKGAANWWKVALGFAVNLLWVITAAYVLYRLGIQPPVIP